MTDNFIHNKWYVITGGPSTGKSTLIDILSKDGFKAFPESARVLIDEAIKNGTSLESLRSDERKFQAKVLEHKIKLERKCDADITTFFDRGMHDTLAYLRLNKFSVGNELTELLETYTYRKIFLLDPFDHYVKDYARTETADESRELNRLLAQAYEEYGQTVIHVPVLPPRERAEFVLQYVQ